MKLENQVIERYNFILNKFENLFYNLLKENYNIHQLESMNLTNYIFEITKLYPNEKKAFNILLFLYSNDNRDLNIRTYELINLYEYLKGVLYEKHNK